jgi:hypothetical protein
VQIVRSAVASLPSLRVDDRRIVYPSHVFGRTIVFKITILEQFGIEAPSAAWLISSKKMPYIKGLSAGPGWAKSMLIVPDWLLEERQDIPHIVIMTTMNRRVFS